jgi:hypothetical protein
MPRYTNLLFFFLASTRASFSLLHVRRTGQGRRGSLRSRSRTAPGSDRSLRTALQRRDPRRCIHLLWCCACVRACVRGIFLVNVAERPYISELLPASFNTPNNLFYVRNHLPVPVIDSKEYQLEVAIEGTGTRGCLLWACHVSRSLVLF